MLHPCCCGVNTGIRPDIGLVLTRIRPHASGLQRIVLGTDVAGKPKRDPAVHGASSVMA
jgi:hypothetical protein